MLFNVYPICYNLNPQSVVEVEFYKNKKILKINNWKHFKNFFARLANYSLFKFIKQLLEDSLKDMWTPSNMENVIGHRT